MANETKIMGWGRCKIELAEYDPNRLGSPDTLMYLGTIKDKSTTMTEEDGDTLQAVATGGRVVAEESGETKLTLTTRLIEPDFDTLAGLIHATEEDGVLTITSSNVSGYKWVKFTPHNIGARGLIIPKAKCEVKLGQSEEEGLYADVTFKLLQDDGCAKYQLFTVGEGDWSAVPAKPQFRQSGGTLTITCSTAGAAIMHTDDLSAPFQTYSGPLTLDQGRVGSKIYAKAVKGGVESEVAEHVVERF